jgi:quinol monooxygenase YgiN
MPPAPVTVLIAYRALPGKSAQAREALAALAGTVLAEEPDCLGISLLQNPADDTRFLLHEQWTSQAAYTGPHMQTPHLVAFIQRAAETFAGRPEISFWREPDA